VMNIDTNTKIIDGQKKDDIICIIE